MQPQPIKPCKATLYIMFSFNNDTFLGLLISLMTTLIQLVQWNVGCWRLELKWTICSGAPPEVEGFQLENRHISRAKCVSRVHYSTGGAVPVAGLTVQLPHRELQLWAWLAIGVFYQSEWAHARGGQQPCHLVHSTQSHPVFRLEVWQCWFCVCVYSCRLWFSFVVNKGTKMAS